MILLHPPLHAPHRNIYDCPEYDALSKLSNALYADDCWNNPEPTMTPMDAVGPNQMSSTACPNEESSPTAAPAAKAIPVSYPGRAGVKGSRIPDPPQSALAHGASPVAASRTTSRLPTAPSAPLQHPLCVSAATKAQGPASAQVAAAVAREGRKARLQVKLPVHSQQAAGVQHVPETRSSKRGAALKSSSGVVANLSRWR
jgi:hypothetical protein